MKDEEVRKRQQTGIGAQYPLNRFTKGKSPQKAEISWTRQPHGKKKPTPKKSKPVVDESSEESFPASDPPAWAGNR